MGYQPPEGYNPNPDPNYGYQQQPNYPTPDYGQPANPSTPVPPPPAYPGATPGYGQYGQPSQYGQYGQPSQYGQPAYPSTPYNPYGMPAPQADSRGGLAIAGFVLGIIGVVASLIPLCGFPITIVGIVLSALGQASTQRRTLAQWGLGLSILGIIATIVVFIISFMHAAQLTQ